MILVVVDTVCSFPEEKKLSVTPTEVRYNSTLACFKVNSIDLPRKRPTSCIRQHPKVGDYVMELFSVCFYVFCFSYGNS